MGGEPADAEEIFPGSEGGANLVAWIDRLLVDVREGRLDEARREIDSGRWRAEMDLTGVPRPIVDQAADTLAAAAAALRDGSTDAAAEALLLARSRFLPGA